MRKIYLFLYLQILSVSFIDAQAVLSCGNSPATGEEIRFIREEIATISLDRNDELICIPVQPYIFTQANNTGGLTEIELNTGLSFLNYHFINAGIQFYWAGNPFYIADNDLFDFNKTETDLNGADTENELVTRAGQSTTAVNLYFINTITQSNGNSVEGYAYYPGNSPVSNRIFVTNHAVSGADNGTLVHEFGHYFGLLHTHEGTCEGPFSNNAENVTRSGENANCFTKGDLICDTDSDPKFTPSDFDYTACTYEGIATDRFGQLYQPMTGNIMSFYPDNCGGYFTPGQYERIQQGLEARLAATFYSLVSNSGVQQAPSILNASYNPVSGSVQLEWTNLPVNNTGFLIERTSDINEHFTILPGAVTGFLATSFTDTEVEEGKTYSYRLKPANGSCYVYSGIASVSIQTVVCTPVTTAEIGNAYIDMFRLKENTLIHLMKNSAYQYSGYSDYTDEAIIVNAGTTLQLLARAHQINNQYTAQNVSIWIDINGDNDFTDEGELLFQSTGVQTSATITGEIKLPANLNPGLHRLRLRSRIAPETAAHPCTDYDSGETEDYLLHIETIPAAEASDSQQNNTNLPEILQSETAVKEELLIFPNPVLNQTSIEFESALALTGLITISDINGLELYSKEYELMEGRNTIPMDLQLLPEGLYIISVGSPYQLAAKTIFKKNDD